MKRLLEQVLQLITVDIWKLSEVEGLQARLYRWLKVLIITAKEITQDKVFIQASALTYFSMLSIVPVIATIFGVSKGFGFEELIDAELEKFFVGQEEVLRYVSDFAKTMLEDTKGGVIAGIGVVVLVYTVMRLLNNIESAFNTIWHVRRPRTWIRKFTDYLAIVIFAPILLLVSSGLRVFFLTQTKQMAARFDVLGFIEPFVLFVFNLSPYVLIWLLFTLVFMIMPNTRVRLKSALIAGVIAGTLYLMVQWGFINLQIITSNYGAIYGTFAFLPLFLLFTQISWTIVFIGAEVSYAHQNTHRYVPQDSSLALSARHKKKIVLLVMSLIVKRFENGEQPLTKVEVVESLRMPYRFAADALNDLVHAGVLLRSKIADREVDVYLPAIDIQKITVEYVLNRLDEDGLDDGCADMDAIDRMFAQLKEERKNSASNVLVRDL